MNTSSPILGHQKRLPPRSRRLPVVDIVHPAFHETPGHGPPTGRPRRREEQRQCQGGNRGVPVATDPAHSSFCGGKGRVSSSRRHETDRPCLPQWGSAAPAGPRRRRGAMITAVRPLCPNPACSCEPSDGGCSPWCRALDRPAGEWCRCGHDGCTSVPAWAPSAWPTRLDWRAMTRAPGAAGARWLVVVRREPPELERAVRRWFDERLCLVLVDRRRADRRRGGGPLGTDRRRAERRQAATPREAEQWLRDGYRLVYRGEAAWPRAGRRRSPGGDVPHAGGEP